LQSNAGRTVKQEIFTRQLSSKRATSCCRVGAGSSTGRERFGAFRHGGEKEELEEANAATETVSGIMLSMRNCCSDDK
jgi:hypothetical protein